LLTSTRLWAAFVDFILSSPYAASVAGPRRNASAKPHGPVPELHCAAVPTKGHSLSSKLHSSRLRIDPQCARSLRAFVNYPHDASRFHSINSKGACLDPATGCRPLAFLEEANVDPRRQAAHRLPGALFHLSLRPQMNSRNTS
jgi:hypothetical protein